MVRKTNKRGRTISKKSMKWYQRGALAFVALSSILLITVLYLAISKATIRIVPKPQSITAIFQMRIIDTPLQVGDVTGFVREERLVRSKTFTLPSEGAEPIEDRATGSVTIFNDSPIPQQLVATTRLLSEDDILFRLDEATNVPANGSVNVQVTADQPGISGEIDSSRFTIPGLREPRQQEVYAQSSSPMTGGIRYIRPLRQSDIESAKDSWKKDLKSEFMDKWREEIPSSFDRSEIFIDLDNVRVDSEIGEEIGVFTLNADIKISAIFYPDEAIIQFAEAALVEATGQGLKLISKGKDSIRLNLLEINSVENTARLSGEIDGRVIIDQSNQILQKNRFTQLSESEVIEMLNTPDLIETVNVDFTPFWLKRLPRLPDHINIQILSE